MKEIGIGAIRCTVRSILTKRRELKVVCVAGDPLFLLELSFVFHADTSVPHIRNLWKLLGTCDPSCLRKSKSAYMYPMGSHMTQLICKSCCADRSPRPSLGGMGWRWFTVLASLHETSTFGKSCLTSGVGAATSNDGCT